MATSVQLVGVNVGVPLPPVWVKLTGPRGDPTGVVAVSVTVAVHVVESVARSPGSPDGEHTSALVVLCVTVIACVPVLGW